MNSNDFLIGLYVYLFQKIRFLKFFMDASNIIDFGIYEDFSITFNTGNITNIFPLNHRECIASTSKEIIRFERKIIKARYPYTFSSCFVVPDTEFIVGVTFKYGTFTVFKLSDVSEPLLKDYQTNHHGIFHMFYSHKSNSIITIGSGIRVFTLRIEYPDKKIRISNPKVLFTQRSSFANDYETTILTPPPFDPETELIYLPTSNGICPFTLDGKQLTSYTRIAATIKTVYTFNRHTKELLTYDTTDGMSLWGPSDNLICHFSTAGSSLIAMLFVDEENVICFNSFNSLFYLNTKTGRTFHCISLQQRPTRLFLVHVQNQPVLFVCFGNSMKALKVVIPWKVWNINVKETVSIQRCNKFFESARVLVAMRGSFVKLYTPKSGEKVTVATPKLAVNSSSFFYDRGVFERYVFNKEKLEFSMKIEKTLPGGSRDVLFVVLENGRIIEFNTTVSPCEEVMSVKTKATFMTICRYNEKWCYAVCSPNSDLYILDYQNLKETNHFTVVNDRLLKFFYHYESESIVMIFSRKTILFDLKKGQIGDVLSIEGNNVTSLFANMLKYGYESGYIAHVEIENGKLIATDKNGMQRPHSEAVSCFSFSLCFWISVGVDGKVIFWNYANEKIYQLSFPIALRVGAIMNGKRDVLVATDSEIMIIEGCSLFNKNDVDREISEIDNFDRLNDNLSSEVIFPLPTHDEDEDEALLRQKIDDDEYEYEEEEIKEIVVNNYKKIEQNSIKLNDEQNVQKKVVAEDTEEDKKKKLEAMQALNGIRQKIPELEEKNKQDSSKSKEKSKKQKKQSSISRHDEKSLKNFIDSSMELEKEKKETKTKKEKSAKKGNKKANDDDDLKNSKELMIEINKPIEKDDSIEKQNNDQSNDSFSHDDDDDNLVLKMKKTEKNRKNENNDIEEKAINDEIKENPEFSNNQNQVTNVETEKQKLQKEEYKEPVKEKKSQNDNKKSKEIKSSSEKVEKQKTPENNKKNLISVGTQPDKEEKAAKKDEKKEKNEIKQTQTKANNKPEPKQSPSKSIEKVEPKQNRKKSVEKEETKKSENEKKSTQKQKQKPKKDEEETKSDNKTKQKNKETKVRIKPPNSSPPPEHQKVQKKAEIPKSNPNPKPKPKPKADQKSHNFKSNEIEKKAIKPPIEPPKKVDLLSGKKPRCPTPPPIRWKKPTVTKKPIKRASTPPLRNKKPIMFSIPPPNIILDKSAILEFYGRGKTELKPLVDMIHEEEERVRMSLFYYTFHVKNFGSINRFDATFSTSFAFKPPPSGGRPSCRNRFFYRRANSEISPNKSAKSDVLIHLPPTRPTFYNCFFFIDEDENDQFSSKIEEFNNNNSESDLKNAKNNTKSEITSNENLPKFHEMQYAPPLNLLEQGKRQPTIRMPQNSSRKSQVHKQTKIMNWPNTDLKSEEIDNQFERNSKSKRNGFSNYKQSEVRIDQPPSSARNSYSINNLETPKPNWSLFYPNFEDYRKNSNQKERTEDSEDGVDLLANAVMLKVPSLELPVSSGYRRTSKSVRMRSPQQQRRVVPGMFFHPNEKEK